MVTVTVRVMINSSINRVLAGLMSSGVMYGWLKSYHPMVFKKRYVPSNGVTLMI